MTRITLGFRAKTGRAIGVALAPDRRTGRVVWRGEISLVDPNVAATAQPYHAVMELPWPDSIRAAAPFVAAIEKAAVRALTELRDELRGEGLSVGAIGVVGSADRDLTKIGNPHIRAHAAEGILFRQVIERAASGARLRNRAFTEESLRASARAQLHLTPRVFRQRLKDLGQAAGPPWRAEEQAAAGAAWLMQRR